MFRCKAQPSVKVFFLMPFSLAEEPAWPGPTGAPAAGADTEPGPDHPATQRGHRPPDHEPEGQQAAGAGGADGRWCPDHQASSSGRPVDPAGG